VSDQDPAPRDASSLARLVLAPCVLVVLAATQMALVSCQGLSPWKGGGFGMFSTNDHGAFRSVRVVALEPEGEASLELGRDWGRRRREVRDHPSSSRLDAFARDVSAGRGRASPLRVEIWRLRFDADDLRPSQELWRTHRWTP